LRRAPLSTAPGLWVLAAALVAACGGDSEPPVDPARARLEAEVAEVRQALEDGAGEPARLHFRLGTVFERYGLLDSAAAAYGRATAAHAAFPEAHYQLGQVDFARGRVGEALEAYRQAVRWAPDFAAAHSNLGYLHKMRGELDEAEAAYLEALRCDSTFAEARNNLGQVYKEREEWEQAIACYRAAIRVSPDLEQAYANLAMSLRETGRADEEAELLQEMASRFASSRTGAYAASRLQELRALGPPETAEAPPP